MITCPGCNTELEDGAKFCDNCGQKIFETIFCPECGAKMTTEFAFCQNCGASLAEEEVKVQPKSPSAASTPTAPVTPKEPVKTQKAVKNPESKKKGIPFIKPIIAAVVVLVLVVLVFKVLGGKGTDRYGIYAKEGEILYTDFSGDSWEITENLMNGEKLDSELAEGLGCYVTFSEDGTEVIYPDNSSYDGVELFYRRVDKPKKEPVKIDSEVYSYAVNEDFNRITYLKGDEGNLYQHDLKEKEKIASDVRRFDVSDDGKTIVYLNDDGGFYQWKVGKDKEKIASDIEALHYVSNDLSTIYYSKEGSLYKQTIGKEKEKIDSDICNVVDVYESGEIYYVKEEVVELKLMDYVEDDMKASDDAMQEPERPEYPSWSDYDSSEEYDMACERYEQEYEAYEQAYEKYGEKQSRDRMRENLAEATRDLTKYSLYYYNGKEEIMVTDALAEKYAVASAKDRAVAEMKVYSQTEVEKVYLSETSSTSEVYDLIDAAMCSSYEHYVIIEDSMNVIPREESWGTVINDAGDTMFYIDSMSDNQYGDLYQVKISGNSVKSAELYDTDVDYYSGCRFLSDTIFAYYKNSGTNSGDLFINGKEVDYDVALQKVYLKDGSNAVLYYTDWNGNMGALNIYENGKSTKIQDDVHSYALTADGNIIYLYDYSSNSNMGTLYLYKNKKGIKVDEDVSAILTKNKELDDSERGFNYGW